MSIQYHLPQYWQGEAATQNEDAELLQRRRRLEARKARVMAEQKRIALTLDNPKMFPETEGLYRYDPDGCITSQELYAIYREWCTKEKLPLSAPRAFWLAVKNQSPYHGLCYSGQIRDSRGKRVRGFRGIRPLTPEEKQAENTYCR